MGAKFVHTSLTLYGSEICAYLANSLWERNIFRTEVVEKKETHCISNVLFVSHAIFEIIKQM
jgi:hypothetical protein